MRAGLLLLLVASTGCGALFAPKMRSVTVMSNPPGAQVLVDGQAVGVTPGIVNVVNKKSHTLTFRLGGYQDGVCQLASDVRALWIILDILAGVVPIIIDAATGAWNEVSVTTCNVNMIPMNVPPPPPPAPGMGGPSS